MMLRRLSFALCFAVLAQTGTAQDNGGTVAFATNDPVMGAAIQQARETLPLFLCASVDDEGYGPQGAFLKVAVPVNDPRMDDEVIWVGPFAAWDGKNFAGLLANQLVAMPGLNMGDQIDFTYDMIADWSWAHPSGAFYGDYTTRVIYRQQGDLGALSALTDPPYDTRWNCK